MLEILDIIIDNTNCFIVLRLIGSNKVVGILELILSYLMLLLEHNDKNDISFHGDWLFKEVQAIKPDISEFIEYLEFLNTVLIVSYFIFKYTYGYLTNDTTLARFYLVFTMFIFTMICYIVSNNLISIFITWEFLGIISSLLVSHWFVCWNNNKSALKAIFVNRIGDYGLTLVTLYGIYNFTIIMHDKLPIIIQIALLLAVMTKSAQLFLHFWLPDAMAAPTPVSSLLHAATMVTAGLFLFSKFSLSINYFIVTLLLIFSLSTLLISGLTASLSSDLKKIIAFSTCSQLGLLSISLCIFQGNYIANFIFMFHLLNHAYFKANLFLNAGALIHGLNDNQDIRKFGNLIYSFKVTILCIIINCLSLSAINFTSSFFSKDLILDSAWILLDHKKLLSFILISISIVFTIFYALLPIKYLTDYNSNFVNLFIFNSTDIDYIILIVLILFLMLSILYPIYYLNLQIINYLIVLYVGIFVLIIVLICVIIYENLQTNITIYFSELFNLRFFYDLFSRRNLNINSIFSYIFSFKMLDKSFYFNFYIKYLTLDLFRFSKFMIYRNFNLNIHLLGFLFLQLFCILVFTLGYLNNFY